MYIFDFVENFAPDHAYYNIANSSVTLSMADEQSQGAAKPQPEPLKNGSMPSAESSGENNGVEQVSAPAAQELASAGNADVHAQPSVDDDVTNVCKVIIRKRSPLSEENTAADVRERQKRASGRFSASLSTTSFVVFVLREHQWKIERLFLS